MRFSEQWLREWVNPALSTDELCHRLTMAGLEVDAVEPAAASFSGVVVGHVVEVSPHPDADKLRVCKVDVGDGEPLDIVCGAPNVYAGMKAPTATVGAVLPGEFKIKKAKLRGVPSFGMLCSARELGLSEDHAGLMDLPADSPVGEDLRRLMALDDQCIELGLTPNRGDCLGIAGIAREVGALTGADVTPPAPAEVPAASDATFPVEVTAAADCPRYVGRVLRGVDPNAQTPAWMQERLRRSGVRSLGPVVDVTNFVLLELGQPMHAFDLNRLQGGIRVRRAVAGERLKLLNESEVALCAEDLVIADERGPVALAGIMGGADSAVDDATRDLFLESAFFPPTAIAGRARGYGLHTDSSHRFERGVDPALQRRALERATELLLLMVGGEAGPVIEVVDESQLPKRLPVPLRASRIERVLGGSIAAQETAAILGRLGMAVVEEGNGWRVTPPSFRFDIAIEEDLIEEVGRVWGYSRIPSALPQAPLTMIGAPEANTPLSRLRSVLIERGYQEAITYSFVDPKLQRLLDPEREPVALTNPISADLAVMRTSLWPGLMQAVLHNVNRQQARVRLFESGLRFVSAADGLRQDRILAGVAFGPVRPEQWSGHNRSLDFYDMKGDVAALLGGATEGVTFVKDRHSALHPGQSARVERDGESIGWLGCLHPQVQDTLDLPGRVFLFELRLAALERATLPSFTDLSRFPAIRRDIAVVVERDMPAERVLGCIRNSAPTTLRELKLFDVYAGERIDSGRKSLAIGLTLQDRSRTLTDDEVDAAIAKVVSDLGERLGATLRE